jgi:UDP-N-acetylglucosamine 3-dehydrogenase
MEKLNIGIIGVANFGAVRRTLMRESGLYNVKYAFDINEEALKVCQKEENCEIVSSYEEMLSKDDIDAIMICTGGKFHRDNVIDALNAGKHVFCEKPLASTKQEVIDILNKQKETNKVVHIGHKHFETDSVSVKIKEMMNNGELGKITAFERTTCHNGGLLIKEGDWRGDKDKNPGGMLFQCGVHEIHNLIKLFGPIKTVSAIMRYDVHTTQTADAAICMLEFESGVIGNLNAYHVCSYRHTFNIFGTNSNIYINKRYFHEGTSFLVQPALINEHCPMNEIKLEGQENPVVPLIDFYNSIKSNDTSSLNLEEAAGAVMAVFAAEESFITKKQIVFKEFFK